MHHQKLTYFFKDKTGNVVIWQKPNFVLYGWIACKIIEAVIQNTQIDNILHQLSVIFLVVWACLEVFTGISPFRRLLGFVVLVITIVPH